MSTAIGAGLLVVGAPFADGALQGALWALALLLDMGGPLPVRLGGLEARAEPLRRAPRPDRDHRARRVDRGDRRGRAGRRRRGRGRGRGARDRRRRRALVALLRRRRAGGRAAPGERRAPGRERNEIARDSFSYLHFPMVAGIVLLALGMKKTLAHVERPARSSCRRSALLGGTALYLLAHVAFRWRNVHRFSAQRLLAAVVLRRADPRRRRAARARDAGDAGGAARRC